MYLHTYLSCPRPPPPPPPSSEAGEDGVLASFHRRGLDGLSSRLPTQKPGLPPPRPTSERWTETPQTRGKLHGHVVAASTLTQFSDGTELQAEVDGAIRVYRRAFATWAEGRGEVGGMLRVFFFFFLFFSFLFFFWCEFHAHP